MTIENKSHGWSKNISKYPNSKYDIKAYFFLALRTLFVWPNNQKDTLDFAQPIVVILLTRLQETYIGVI